MTNSELIQKVWEGLKGEAQPGRGVWAGKSQLIGDAAEIRAIHPDESEYRTWLEYDSDGNLQGPEATFWMLEQMDTKGYVKLGHACLVDKTPKRVCKWERYERQPHLEGLIIQYGDTWTEAVTRAYIEWKEKENAG